MWSRTDMTRSCESEYYMRGRVAAPLAVRCPFTGAVHLAMSQPSRFLIANLQRYLSGARNAMYVEWGRGILR